ncbi:MAG: DsrE family protein [Bacteroidetes bacterium]|nr:DsrE family protein [Bacteroidota bacterium]
MKNFLLVLLLFPAVLFGQKADPSVYPHKIVMQLTSSDPEVHKGLMKQISNLTQGWKDSVFIEVVCHGPGIQMLMSGKSTQAESIKKYHGSTVRFVACENTLKAKQIPVEEIIPGLDFVMMGIAEIVMKQEQGWSYIKAGY